MICSNVLDRTHMAQTVPLTLILNTCFSITVSVY